MSKTIKIQLNPSCILTVPFHIYDNDFTFIVNGEEFKTSKLISDLLSPVICQIHLNDPTFDIFIINTQESGSFSHLLDLFNFKKNNISDHELPFIQEVIEILGNQTIECDEWDNPEELTVNNVFSTIKYHEKHCKIFSARLEKEIEFISTHFTEIYDSQEEEFENLSVFTLNSIFSNDKLELESEDQLLRIVNKLYTKDVNYSILYETVFFENVSSEAMKEFVSIFDINELTVSIWRRLADRLVRDTKTSNDMTCDIKNRYKKADNRGTVFPASEENQFKGIINYLRTQSNGKIYNEVDITSSSNLYGSREDRHPRVVALYEDEENYFVSSDIPNIWLMFDFKKHRVAPTGYTIRSYASFANSEHPKSWVIEGSNDSSSWEEIDEQVNCGYLNGKSFVHTFKIKNETSKEYRYIRMRLTGPNWLGNNQLIINSFEIYGKLI
ncbi:hypothetical protein M9Y10_026363 [Tritrichomonas musculus]|uniref:F5/8 type C domain-containing protein n=1 Tax=Tritrichomonas musculus TaxID=1915356 RepID=A0ABR2H8E7_9EUKA